MYSLKYIKEYSKLYISRNLANGCTGMCIEMNLFNTDQIHKLRDILKQEIKRREDDTTNVTQV